MTLRFCLGAGQIGPSFLLSLVLKDSECVRATYNETQWANTFFLLQIIHYCH